jgi:hypothetical protein
MARDFTGAAGIGFGPGAQFLVKDLAHELDTGQVLAQTIVQVLAEAPALLITDFKYLSFETPPFGDIAKDNEPMSVSPSPIGDWTDAPLSPALPGGSLVGRDLV